MRTFGWIFLAGYSLDAVLSTIACYVPGFLFISNIISAATFILIVIAFVLALLGKLAPRVVFVSLCGYYFILLALGVVLGFLLAIKLGPEKLQRIEVTPQFLREQFDWFGSVQLVFLIAWLLLAVYGVVSYGRAKPSVELGVAADQGEGH